MRGALAPEPINKGVSAVLNCGDEALVALSLASASCDVPLYVRPVLLSTLIGRPSFRHQPFVVLARVWIHTIDRENAVIGRSAPLVADPQSYFGRCGCSAAWQPPCTFHLTTHADRHSVVQVDRGAICTCRTLGFIRMSQRKAASILSLNLLQS